MPSHLHLVFRAVENNPSVLLGRFKEYTSKQLVKTIEQNIQESRRDWMLPMFKEAGAKSSNVQFGQFWQHDSRPIELWSPKVFNQKVEYVHNNPVVSGFVNEPCHWKYSSTIDYSGGKGLIEIHFFSWNTHDTRALAGIEIDFF